MSSYTSSPTARITPIHKRIVEMWLFTNATSFVIYLHVVLHCVFAVTDEFMSRKFNSHVDGKQGTAPSGAATVSVTVNHVRECLQLCQESVILNNCRAVNFHAPTGACDLMDDYATEITDVTDTTYWELVTGE